MRIGIMSMQRIENYGSFLQAYSLRKILEELGHQVIFVDYMIEPCIVHEPAQDIPHYSIPHRIVRKTYYLSKDIIRHLDGEKAEEQRIDSMRLRIKYPEYLRALGITERRIENTPVDVLVVGSDEVFNCLQTNPAVGYSKQLFGNYHQANKIVSYAASAGFTTIDGLKKYGIYDEVSDMLKDNFCCISVRDDNTYNLVKTLTGITPEMHLDPVLVGDFSGQIIEKHDLDKYVVVYSYEERMSDRADEAESIQRFAHENGLKTVSIGNFQKWTDLKIEASPFELLGYIKNADYIITDTFHGTIFSIVLKKQFVTIVRESNKQKLNALLKKFSLENRQLRELSELSEILVDPIDFSKANYLREFERKRTVDYLSKVLEE